MTAVKNVLLGILMLLDTLVFWLVSVIYRVFILISKASLYNTSNDKISELTDRIFVILGVAMLFVMAYNIILLIMNPDKMSNSGDKSLQGLLKNLVISVVILTLLPTIFDYMSRIQNNILDSHVIENVILGAGSESDSKISTEDMGDRISTMLFSIFYHPIDDNGKIIMYADCKSDAITDKPKICDDYVKAYEKAETNGSFTSFMDDSLMNELSTGIFNPVANMQYIWGISTIVGLVCIFMFATYVFDVGVRLVKLTFLQIIAPIPVILRITKPSGGMFSKWLDMLIQTYTLLFTRLITIYFSVFTVGLIADGFMSVDGGIFGATGEENGLIILFGYLFVIVGIFLFAKEFPELLNKFVGGAAGGSFGWSAIKKKFSNAYDVATSIPLAGRAFSKASGGLTGGLGAAATALMNRRRKDDPWTGSAMDAFKDGAEAGFRRGGMQFGTQRERLYKDRYGYDAEQGLLGGPSINDRVKNSSWNKAASSKFVEDAKKANEDMLKQLLEQMLPNADDESMKKIIEDMKQKNLNFENSPLYKGIASQVDTALALSGKRVSADERQQLINEELKNRYDSTQNQDEKRAILSHLKRGEIIDSYERSMLANPNSAENTSKVNEYARQVAMKNVEHDLKENGLTAYGSITDTTAKKEIEARVDTKIKDKNYQLTSEQSASIEQKVNQTSYATLSATQQSSVNGVIDEQISSGKIELKPEQVGNIKVAEAKMLKDGFSNLPVEVQTSITTDAKKTVEVAISNAGGVSNITLSDDQKSRVSAKLEELSISKIQSVGGAQNVTFLSDVAEKIKSSSNNAAEEKINREVHAKIEEWENGIRSSAVLTDAQKENMIFTQKEKMINNITSSLRDSKFNDYYNEAYEQSVKEQLKRDYEETTKSMILFDDERDRLMRESIRKIATYDELEKSGDIDKLKDNLSKSIMKKDLIRDMLIEEEAKQELVKKEQEKVRDNARDALIKHAKDEFSKESEEYVSGLLSSKYTNNSDGSKDSVYSPTFEHNDKIIERGGAKKKSERDKFMDDIEEFIKNKKKEDKK